MNKRFLIVHLAFGQAEMRIKLYRQYVMALWSGAAVGFLTLTFGNISIASIASSSGSFLIDELRMV